VSPSVDAAVAALSQVASIAFAGANPFRQATALQLALTRPQNAKFEIFDVSGRRVRTLLDRKMEPGSHRLRWDGTSETGKSVPSGVYFFKVGSEEVSRMMRVVRRR